ncbi:unnamed protein product [Sphagnum balticum]
MGMAASVRAGECARAVRARSGDWALQTKAMVKREDSAAMHTLQVEREQLECELTAAQSTGHKQIRELKCANTDLEDKLAQLERSQAKERQAREDIQTTSAQFAAEMQVHMDEIELKLSEEHKYRRKADKAKASAQEELDALVDSHRRLTLQAHKDLVTRIKTSLSWMAHRKENNCLSRMSTFRLECDYRRVKGELEAEKTAHEQTRERANGDTASSRGSSSSLLSAYRSRRYSSQADMAILQEKISIGFDCAKRIDELEKENRDLDREKRETRRELNNMKLALHDEIEEKESLYKQLKALRADADRANSALVREEARNSELERSVTKAHSDTIAWRTRCEQARLLTDEQVANEKLATTWSFCVLKLCAQEEDAREVERSNRRHTRQGDVFAKGGEDVR